MSEQEGPLDPPAKPRPEVPPKPSAQPEAPSSEGKVRSIVSKFSRQDSVSKETEDRAVNGSSKVTKMKRVRRPPSVKPKPKAARASLPARLGQQAPPLPVKSSRKPKEADRVEERSDVHAEGSRSGTRIIHDFDEFLRKLAQLHFPLGGVFFCLRFCQAGMEPGWLLAAHPLPKY